MSASKDLYKLLGIPRNATKKAIREAYYQRAKQLHPDRQKNNDDSSSAGVNVSSKIKDRDRGGGGGDANSQLFKEITQAYQILSNDEERRKYDMQQYQHQYGSSSSGSGDFNVDAQSAYEYWYALHRRRMMEEQQRMKGWQSDPSQYHSYFDSDGGDYNEYRYKHYYRYHKSPHSFNDFYNSRYGAAGMGPNGFSIHRGIRRSMNRNRAMLLRFWLLSGCMFLIYLFMAMVNQYRWYRIPEEEAMYYNRHYAAQRRAQQQQQQQQYQQQQVDDPFAMQEMQYRRAIERRRQRRKEEEEEKKKKNVKKE